jgi:hypothetical protein
MATPQPIQGGATTPAIDLDSLTPEQAWELWKPVSDECIRRAEAGEEGADIVQVAAEMGVPLEVGYLIPPEPEDEAEAQEWVEALIGDVGDALE